MYTSIENKEFPRGNMPFDFKDEAFAMVTDFPFEPYYANMGIKGAVDKCCMRYGVWQKLKLAQSYLPEGYCLKIYDAWRPYEVQYALYTQYCNKLKDENPGLTPGALHELVRRFVSLPVKDVLEGPVHATGGSVDVTIIDKTGKELNMGTAFDYFGDMAHTAYFETNNSDNEAKNNRRMLYHVMTKAGFTNLPTEWWHFDYGNKFHSFYSGQKAIYGCVFEPCFLK